MAVHHKAPIASRIGGAETEHGDARMMIDRAAQPLQRVSADQRRIAEDHKNVVGALRNRVARRKHGICGAPPLGLNEHLRLGQHAPRFIRDRIGIRPDHHRDRLRSGAAHGGQHMRQHRAPRDRVQHLRQRRAHACAFPSGKHDRKAGSFAHRDSGRSSAPSYWEEAI